MNENIKSANPLGTQKESKLLVKFAIPCIISMLVTALYNIVDQIFIGQGIGINGNAATNITFPLSTTCTAISLLLGIGSATNVSLKLGAKEEEEAANYAGCLIRISDSKHKSYSLVPAWFYMLKPDEAGILYKSSYAIINAIDGSIYNPFIGTLEPTDNSQTEK